MSGALQVPASQGTAASGRASRRRNPIVEENVSDDEQKMEDL